MKKIVLILGMHRSGTSVFSAATQELGFHLGSELLEPSAENMKGFFENARIVDFNDRLLTRLGGRWDNPLFDGPQALTAIPAEALRPWEIEAAELLDEQFGAHTMLAIKDPRLCQLLPFWHAVLREQGFSPADILHVHVNRHPVSMAMSQRKRVLDTPAYYFLGSDPLQTVCLWMSLLDQALQAIRGSKACFFFYEDMLLDPAAVLEQLAQFLEVPLPEKTLATFCNEFVDQRLARQGLDDRVWADILARLPVTAQVHEKLRRIALDKARHPAELEELGNLIRDCIHGPDFLAPLIPLFSAALDNRHRLFLERDAYHQAEQNEILARRTAEQKLETERQAAQMALDTEKMARLHAERQLKNTERERKAFQDRVAALEDSLSWRITAPLRSLGRIKQRGVMGAMEAWFRLTTWLGDRRMRLKVRRPRAMACVDAVVYPPLKMLDMLLRRLFYRKMQDRTGLAQMTAEKVSMYQHQPPPPAEPKVSVIVPNYNHAGYLRKRLDSIYDQTYRNIEVILLDDCSSDQSRSILEDYAQRYPDRTIRAFNETRSDGVFAQWCKGISLASGELIWIAESDDWCSENFLEELTGYFQDEAVLLACARTVFVNGDDETSQIWSTEEFLADLDGPDWTAPFIATAHRLVNQAWAVKNIVPNVSGALFRRPESLPLLHDQEWKHMKVCGDWLFYLHLARGGLVAYTPAATNYYRQHPGNASVNTHKEDSYYREHARVLEWMLRLYKVGEGMVDAHRAELEAHWKRSREESVEGLYARCFSQQKISAARQERRPNLLMAGYAFASGGGEMFPIILANLFKKAGYAVTFLSFEQLERIPQVRSALHADIPVVTNYFSLPGMVHDFGIEIMHSHHAWVDNTILDILPDKPPCRLVASMHGMYESMSPVEWKRVLPRMLSRFGKLVYTARKNLAPFQASNTHESEKLVRIENALEIYPVAPADLSSLDIPENAFVLCMVSRAIPEKGWEEAIQMVDLAREQSSRDIHLILIGDGPECDRLAHLCGPHIHFLGFRHDIRSFFAAADLGFLPTRFPGESYPLVLIDCLHSGRPMLATDLGEIKSMLEVGDGRLAGAVFPLEQGRLPLRQGAALIALYADDKQAYAEIMARVPAASEKFCINRLRAAYEQVYLELVTTTKG
jgi:O-antigen biosynthesis protein